MNTNPLPASPALPLHTGAARPGAAPRHSLYQLQAGWDEHAAAARTVLRARLLLARSDATTRLGVCAAAMAAGCLLPLLAAFIAGTPA
jgi:hypothetical protein